MTASATRYCGTLEIIITLNVDDSYNVVLVETYDDARFETLEGIRLSPYMANRVAADSAVAFDAVARAALSFAGNEDDDVYRYVEWSETSEEPAIRRYQ